MAFDRGVRADSAQWAAVIVFRPSPAARELNHASC